MEIGEGFPVATSGHPISQLGHHLLGRYKLAVEGFEMLYSRFMRAVLGIEVGEKEERVCEEALHFLA